VQREGRYMKYDGSKARCLPNGETKAVRHETPRVTQCIQCFVALEAIHPNCAVPVSCTVFLYYRKILNASDIYLGHPQRVTNLVDLCIYGNLSLIFGRLCVMCVMYITNNRRVHVAAEIVST